MSEGGCVTERVGLFPRMPLKVTVFVVAISGRAVVVCLLHEIDKINLICEAKGQQR